MREEFLNMGVSPSSLVDLIMTGESPGSCGSAIVIRNCRAVGHSDKVLRSVLSGTLVQVWNIYDDVIFSPYFDSGYTSELEPTRLVCKPSDIARVPSLLWGALMPLRSEVRVAIAKKETLAGSLTEFRQDSRVKLTDDGCVIAEALIVTKICDIKGVLYGVKIMGKLDTCEELAKVLSLYEPERVPTGCDAVVDLSRLLPAKFLKTVLQASRSNVEREYRGSMPKSASHHSLREDPHQRQAFVSLEISNLSKSAELKMAGVHKPHTISRSLDLPSTGEKRLTRDRACTSLDGGSAPKSKEGHGKSQNSDLQGSRDLTVGSLVEIDRGSHDGPQFGVIHWIGKFSAGPLVAGIELEEEIDENIDTHNFFECRPYRATFVKLSSCQRDSRFVEPNRRFSTAHSNSAFGCTDCPVVEGTIPPISTALKDICGKYRGIQGHNNSCYLDATLFSMFAFTSVMDSLLYRPRSESDHPQYTEVQSVLRDEIVNPLRKNLYVRADRVMKLRKLLDRLSSVTGLTSEEKDPEEFLNSLLSQILKAEPLLHLSSGQEAFYYQLFVEKDESLTVPTVQQLLEQSFVSSDIKLKQMPACLILQMPRFGKSFKMYPKIIPSTTIDVTDLIENSPRQCAVCGKLAQYECKECYCGEGLDGGSGSYCVPCVQKVHEHHKRAHHRPSRLSVPPDCHELVETGAVPRLTMDLFAVVCIETSHYVAFLNTDRGWVFFDSMADRKGEQNGYNIPEMVFCPKLQNWVSEEAATQVPYFHDEKELPVLAKRLLCDAYMCLYQSPQVMMYR